MLEFNNRGLLRETGKEHHMLTQSGRSVDPFNLQPEDVVIEDIAHSLSRICRYNGHVGGFLSVARHSIWVGDRLWDMTGCRILALWGLLHDATEAYFGDMARPMKYRPEMQFFRDAEDQAGRVIAEVFGLQFPMPAEVHEADHYVTIERELKDERATWESTLEQDYKVFMARFIFFSAYIRKENNV